LANPTILFCYIHCFIKKFFISFISLLPSLNSIFHYFIVLIQKNLMNFVETFHKVRLNQFQRIFKEIMENLSLYFENFNE
jgi:hypothetical protein